MPKRSPRLAVKRLDRLHSRTGTSQGLSPFPSSVSLQMVCFSLSRDLVLCGVSVHVFVHVFVQAKNSNGTTVRTFSYFNLWHIPSLSFHDFSLDVFSFGVVVIQIVTRASEIISVAVRDDLVKKIEVTHPLRSLIQDCIQDEKEKRPSAKDVCHILEIKVEELKTM